MKNAEIGLIKLLSNVCWINIINTQEVEKSGYDIVRYWLFKFNFIFNEKAGKCTGDFIKDSF